MALGGTWGQWQVAVEPGKIFQGSLSPRDREDPKRVTLQIRL